MNSNKHDAAWKAILSAIRKKITEPGESQANVARLLGRNRGTINNWLSGKRGGEKASIDDLLGYMKKLGVDPAPYFGEEADYEGYTNVPWLEATASMGGGSTAASKEIISHLAFKTDWLRYKGPIGSMVVINAEGDSMEPTIPDGSVVLINEASKQAVNGAIYFVRRGEDIYLKRLKVEKGRVVALISDNGPDESPLEEWEDFEIIARALWFGKEI